MVIKRVTLSYLSQIWLEEEGLDQGGDPGWWLGIAGGTADGRMARCFDREEGDMESAEVKGAVWC